MTIEVPVDVAIGLGVIWGMGGFALQYEGQTTRLAPRRVLDTEGNTVVCENDPVTTAYYRYTIDLAVDTGAGRAPTPGMITAPTPPPRRA